MKITSFSGGKDSTALAILEADAMPVFVDPEGENLPEGIKRLRFMPGFKSRWCTRMHKVEVIQAWLMDKVPAEMLIGLRADEEERIGHIVCLDDLTIRYPL